MWPHRKSYVYCITTTPCALADCHSYSYSYSMHLYFYHSDFWLDSYPVRGQEDGGELGRQVQLVPQQKLQHRVRTESLNRRMLSNQCNLYVFFVLKKMTAYLHRKNLKYFNKMSNHLLVPTPKLGLSCLSSS